MSGLIDTSKKWEGRVLDGKFPLQQWLGGSSHSAVFLTNRGVTGSEKAAIKLISAECYEAEKGKDDAQLLRWADIAKLSHPNLMRLFESGRGRIDDANLLYIVMEYAEENLAQVLPQRPLAPEEVEEMLPPAVDALVFLHHAGYVHGHVKPTNIMAVDNQLRISTDGLRKTGEAAERETSAYDAPEVDATGVSPAADVWSLGATLVAVLTQHEPEINDRKGAQGAIPDGVPEPLQEIAWRCLSADPRRRCSLSDVVGLLKGQERQTTEFGGTSAKTKHKRWRSVLAIAAALLVVAVLFGRRLVVQRPPSAPEETRSAEPKSAPANLPTAQSPPPFAEKAEPAQTGNTPGTVLRQILPEVSRSAQSTIHGRVKVSVQVSVDSSGNVSQAKLTSPGPSKYFANQALTASRHWKFNPPQVDGQASNSEWMLRFQFGRTSTQVFPTQIKR